MTADTQYLVLLAGRSKSREARVQAARETRSITYAARSSIVLVPAYAAPQ